MGPDQLRWNELYRARKAVAEKFGAIHSLPVCKRHRVVLGHCLASVGSVLEVGAGDRSVARGLEEWNARATYASVDADPSHAHDFTHWNDCQGSYDSVVALELVEHLRLEELRDFLSKSAELLNPGGWLILSTPNTFHPPAYLRDATHRTPLCYDELGALVTLAGFEVRHIYRIYHDPLVTKWVRRWLFGWLFRLLGLDFAKQILLVARKPA